MSAKRPPRTCPWCGVRSYSGTCLGCRMTEKRAFGTPDYSDGLYGGRWVLDPVRRTQVWEQAW